MFRGKCCERNRLLSRRELFWFHKLWRGSLEGLDRAAVYPISFYTEGGLPHFPHILSAETTFILPHTELFECERRDLSLAYVALDVLLETPTADCGAASRLEPRRE